MAADCASYDLACKTGQGIADFAQGQIADFVKSMAEGAIAVLKALTTFWMELPSPTVTSSAVTTIQENLSWYTFAFALIGIFIALGRMVFTQQFSTGMTAVKMIINLIIVTAVYATAFTALIAASDAFAPWIVEEATGQDLDLAGMLNVELIMSAGIGPGLLMGVLAFLGSLANVIFMLLRAVMIAILFAFLPTLAAASASETGNQAFKKAQGYLLAFVLFKPITGVIYALGFLTITNPPTFRGLDEAGAALFSTAVGVMTLLIASLALPALIKFIVPVAANGTSGAFSGAGMVAAGVAAGGAVVSLGAAAATGGASAAAGGGSAALTGGKAAATAGGQSAASSGGQAAAASSGGGSSAGAGGGKASEAINGSGGGTAGGSGSGSGSSSGNATGGPSSGAGSSGGSSSPSTSGGSSTGGTGTSGGGSGSASTGGAGTSGGAVPAGAAGGQTPTQTSSGSSSGGSAGDTARVLGDLAAAGGNQAHAIDDAAEEK
jgi:type IV secretion system protein TrbL